MTKLKEDMKIRDEVVVEKYSDLKPVLQKIKTSSSVIKGKFNFAKLKVKCTQINPSEIFSSLRCTPDSAYFAATSISGET